MNIIRDLGSKASKWDEKQVASLKLKRDTLQTKVNTLEKSTLSNEIHELSSELLYLTNRVDFIKKDTNIYVDK